MFLTSMMSSQEYGLHFISPEDRSGEEFPSLQIYLPTSLLSMVATEQKQEDRSTISSISK